MKGVGHRFAGVPPLGFFGGRVREVQLRLLRELYSVLFGRI